MDGNSLEHFCSHLCGCLLSCFVGACFSVQWVTRVGHEVFGYEPGFLSPFRTPFCLLSISPSLFLLLHHLFLVIHYILGPFTHLFSHIGPLALREGRRSTLAAATGGREAGSGGGHGLMVLGLFDGAGMGGDGVV